MNREVLAYKRMSTMTRVLFGIRGEAVRRSQVRGPQNMRFWSVFWLL